MLRRQKHSISAHNVYVQEPLILQQDHLLLLLSCETRAKSTTLKSGLEDTIDIETFIRSVEKVINIIQGLEATSMVAKKHITPYLIRKSDLLDADRGTG